ncbi:hypothetical protein GCM10020255_044600 [Rhodococcus baikonurensis]
MATEPDDRDAGDVADQHYEREHQCHEAADAEGRLRQFAIGVAETLDLVRFPHECSDNPDARDLFAKNTVDGVETALHDPETGHHPGDQETHRDHEERDADAEDPGQIQVLPQSHDDAADAHDRRHDEDGATHHDHHLNLLDVVGVSGDQRRRAEVADFPGRERPDLMQHRRSQVASDAHGDSRTEEDGTHRAEDLRQRDHEHHPAGGEDVAGVAFGHTIVDDVGIETRKVKGRHSRNKLQDDNAREFTPVRRQISAQQPDQHSERRLPILADMCRWIFRYAKTAVRLY